MERSKVKEASQRRRGQKRNIYTFDEPIVKIIEREKKLRLLEDMKKD